MRAFQRFKIDVYRYLISLDSGSDRRERVQGARRYGRCPSSVASSQLPVASLSSQNQSAGTCNRVARDLAVVGSRSEGKWLP